ncbi:hypothetical protein OR1_00279 [Geobacter sp. OR-1]|uniref:DUF4124 domain-containing protein n=1 Tax=Geobacter sp. OR-1 TaxID=1266765 RepID=UPI000542BA66|nr:DUF4124 domain-containing protein [Geobacter sp. OR-1]GAM08009.1 hypothetical protein OR1_00279 [Geobacter sp. OR-1]
MRLPPLLKTSIAFCLLSAATVNAEIFTWKDNKGVSHYSNSMYDVPVRYRARVKTVNLGIEEKGDNKQQQAAAPGSAPDAATQPMAAPPSPQPQISPNAPANTGNRPARRPRRSHDPDE